MPKKKGGGGGGKKGGGGGGGKSQKSKQKEQQKIIQDRTFGLKNKKKSAKVQKYVQDVKKQVGQQKKSNADRRAETLKKLEAEQAKRDDPNLFKTAVQQKRVPKGVDPKSLVCQYFKAGHCSRGAKCRYSHDLAVERKTEKINLFEDIRDEKEDDKIDDWDQEKLESVITKKHGQQNRRTTIICKFFLKAVEEKQYGWFWSCPNGDKCIYRHALPPGYVFKSDKKIEEEEKEKLEDQIDKQMTEIKQKQLVTGSTLLTAQSFAQWKARKLAEKKKAAKKRLKDIKSGKQQMSGKEMFEFNPELFVDDDSAMGSSEFRNKDDDGNVYREITATGTSITSSYNGLVEVDGILVDSSLFINVSDEAEILAL